MLDESIKIITEMLIKQDLKDKKENYVETITFSKVKFYSFCIKLLKIIKKCL